MPGVTALHQGGTPARPGGTPMPPAPLPSQGPPPQPVHSTRAGVVGLLRRLWGSPHARRQAWDCGLDGTSVSFLEVELGGAVGGGWMPPPGQTPRLKSGVDGAARLVEKPVTEGRFVLQHTGLHCPHGIELQPLVWALWPLRSPPPSASGSLAGNALESRHCQLPTGPWRPDITCESDSHPVPFNRGH